MASRRLHAFAVLVLAVALAVAATAEAAPAPLRFTSLPKRAVQGGSASVAVALRRPTDRCSLAVGYGGGAPVVIATAVAHAGRASWSWRLPTTVATGAARATVRCAKSGRIAGTLMVVGAVLPPKIDVAKQGFSIKVPKLGSPSISYGVVLANRSQGEDALDVDVLVNFVTVENVLVGSVTKRIKAVRAGSEHVLGSMASFPAAGAVSRLEVVVQVGGHVRHADAPAPALANLRILPSLADPSHVGSFEGELINDNAVLTFSRAALSVVLFDDAGNVIGGGSGNVSASLPPGSRQFFKATSGFSAVPIAKAVAWQVTVEPTYDQPGAA